MMSGPDIWVVVHVVLAILCHQHSYKAVTFLTRWRAGAFKEELARLRIHSREYILACMKVVSIRGWEFTIPRSC